MENFMQNLKKHKKEICLYTTLFSIITIIIFSITLIVIGNSSGRIGKAYQVNLSGVGIEASAEITLEDENTLLITQYISGEVDSVERYWYYVKDNKLYIDISPSEANYYYVGSIDGYNIKILVDNVKVIYRCQDTYNIKTTSIVFLSISGSLIFIISFIYCFTAITNKTRDSNKLEENTTNQ